MPSPITYPIGPLIKWAVRVIPPLYVLGEQLLNQADYGPEDLEWRHLQIVQTRGTPVGTVEDVATISFDLLNITGAAPDSSWTTGDYTAAEAAFNTYLAAIAGTIFGGAIWTQYRWYRKSFANPMTLAHRFADSGPPDRLTTINVPGTSASPVLPYQVSCSMTEVTPWPRHWGRWYLPSLAVAMAANGRYSSTHMNTWDTAAGALMNTLFDAQLPLVVPSTQTDLVLSGHLLGVTGIRVDDVPDIQRRRRPKQAALRSQIDVS